MNKQIKNIVFYVFNGENGVMEQACIFYTDGTVKNVSNEEAWEITEQASLNSDATNILSKIHYLTGKEFERRFKEFLGTSKKTEEQKPITAVIPSEQSSVILGAANASAPVDNTAGSGNKIPKTLPTKSTPSDTLQQNAHDVHQLAPEDGDKPKDDNDKSSDEISIPFPWRKKKDSTTPVSEEVPEDGDKPKDDNDESSDEISIPFPWRKKKDSTTPQKTAQDGEESKGDNNESVPSEHTETKPESKKPEHAKPKKKGLFSRLWTKVTAIILAGAMLLGAGYWIGKRFNDEETNTNTTGFNHNTNIPIQDEEFLNLIAKSTNADQKATMTHQSLCLDTFNRDFASKYIGDATDIQAALTWDEMIAINLAYNTYTKEQIRVMFNGAELDSNALNEAYKNANLQLMGAYVISTRENPVNSSTFLTNEQQRLFVEKYNDLFLKMKETTGQAQIDAINAFYAEIYKDFPIDSQVREEGISHADSKRLVEPYKAAVTPIVAAAEIMFQNVNGIDHTLSDKAIGYFNDLGLCNLATDQFKRAETITLTAETDESLPLYTEYRTAKIKELVYEGNYPTDDAHRDLSKLAEFQKWVNGHHTTNTNSSAVQNQNTTGSRTENITITKTETTSTVTEDRNEAVEKAGEANVKNAEVSVDEQIAQQNRADEEQGKQDAEQNRQQQQQKADEEAVELEKQVSADDDNLEDDINKANQNQNDGVSVKEDDFGEHGVIFDQEDQNDNGELSDSVKDITTDGSGAVDENTSLPDPNEMGAIFDGESINSTNTSTVSSINESTTQNENNSSQDIYEYEESYVEPLTNAQIVDAYIASLEAQTYDDSGYQYTK